MATTQLRTDRSANAAGFVLILCQGAETATPRCGFAPTVAWDAAEAERAAVEAEIARWCPPEDAAELARDAAAQAAKLSRAEAEQAAVEAEIARWCPSDIDPALSPFGEADEAGSPFQPMRRAA